MSSSSSRSTPSDSETPSAEDQFTSEVFPAELDHVERRWRSVYARRDTDDSGKKRKLADRAPTAQNLLVGMAFSGGGARSATFNLGVAQALDRHGILDHVDYLSTVGGGGYVGASISAAMRDGADFSYRDREGGWESPLLTWLRNHSDFGARRGFGGFLAHLGTRLLGVVVNLLALAPYLLLLALLTHLRYFASPGSWYGVELVDADGLLKWTRAYALTPWLIGAAALVLLLLPVTARMLKSIGGPRGRAESGSEKYLRVAGLLLILVVAVAVIETLPYLVFLWLFAGSALRTIGGTLVATLSLLALASMSSLAAWPSGLWRKLAVSVDAIVGLALPILVSLWVTVWLLGRALSSGRYAPALQDLQYFFTPDAPLWSPDSTLWWLGWMVAIALLAVGLAGAVSRQVGRLTRGLSKRARLVLVLASGVAVFLLVGGFLLVAVVDNTDFGRWPLSPNGSVELVAAMALALGVFTSALIDGNAATALGFFKDEIAEAHLIGLKRADESESVRGDGPGLEDVESVGGLELGDICAEGSIAPYHLVNAALNLDGSRDPAIRDRHRDAFLFSKAFVGGERTGYAATELFAAESPGLDLGTAIAISAASAVPSVDRPPLGRSRILKTFFNIRAGYWLPNPSLLSRWASAGLPRWLKRLWIARWRVRPSIMFREMLGRLHARGRWVNVTDGGYFDNLGIYELLRRRCKVIVAGDAEADPEMAFSGLLALTRQARVGLGVRIHISLDDLRSSVGKYSRRHCAVGRIEYPPAREGGEAEEGHLLYIKASVTGDESEEIREYRSRVPGFPHEAAASVAPAEGQFEAYRALGEHAAEDLLRPGIEAGERPGFDALLRQLDEPAGARVVEDSKKVLAPEVPEDLRNALAAGECILYAGAGLSAGAGFPTWRPFVTGLLELAVKDGFVNPSFGDSLAAAIQEGEIDQVADNVVSSFPEEDRSVLFEHLKETFLRAKDVDSPLHKTIRELPFGALLTTNFDELIEKTYGSKGSVLTPMEPEPLMDKLSAREFFILKLYGSLHQPESVMVAPAQYKEVVEGNRPFAKFMETLFFSRTLLFVGASLDGISAYLGGIDLPATKERVHYALVDVEGRAWRSKASILERRYGIQVLPFSATQGHPEVGQFLRDLRKGIDALEKERRSGRAATPAPERVKGKGRRLQRVILKDIGPFRELDLELNATWNILLGDNGVGKSNVLRAIAVALAGKDGQMSDEAQRLIRVGATQGTITLELEQSRIYKTTLKRLSRGVEIESVPPVSPLESEGLLAMGFPPLRSFSYARQKVREPESASRPSPQDLKPLAENALDPRLDKIKELVVWLDYLMKDQKVRSDESSGRYEELLPKFFDMVGFLTEGLEITFGGVNPQSSEIKVTTGDGEVPIEALSQGTASLIGWTGVMLKRLYEVSSSEDPTGDYALVLMDELDAHLHPAWQRRLIGKLEKLFPNCQFVATTHSALIVSGQPAERIFRFIRDPERGPVVIATPEDATMGRTDQLLLGQLFDLDDTIDETTARMLSEYKRLFRKETRQPEEDKEFQKLKDELGFRLPLPEKDVTRRRAFELIESVLEHEVGTPDEQNAKLLERTEKLLDEVLKRRAAS